MLKVQTIHPQNEFYIKTIPSKFTLSIELDNEIDSLWSDWQKKQKKTLFNGLILSAVNVTAERIEAAVVEYRHFIAQQVRPELFDILQIRAIGVSGVFECSDGIVFGRRGRDVTQDAGFWELVPSGGIDASKIREGTKVDFLSQILMELHEETGITPEMVTHLHPFCLVEDSKSHVLDIGIVMKSSLLFDDIVAIHQNNTTNEYDELRLIPSAQVSQVMESKAAEFVDVSAVLIQQLTLDSSKV